VKKIDLFNFGVFEHPKHPPPSYGLGSDSVIGPSTAQSQNDNTEVDSSEATKWHNYQLFLIKFSRAILNLRVTGVLNMQLS